jgi:hypothetical protein
VTGRRGGLRAAPRSSIPLAIAGAFAAGGCGGGLPLLEPARALGTGDVRALAGFSSNVALGSLAGAERNATNEGVAAAAAGQGPTPGDVAYAEGALVAASVAPGIAPVAGAHVGIGDQFEGGLVFTGRALRLDVRRSFSLSETWDLSLGAAGSAVLYGRGGQSAAVPGVDLGSLHGWGADVPLLVGYQSDGDLYMIWFGARGGWQHVDIGPVTSEPGETPFGARPRSLSATQFWGGGVLGGAVGFRHVHVAVELDASYASVSGEFNGGHASVGGASLMPATALWWTF